MDEAEQRLKSSEPPSPKSLRGALSFCADPALADKERDAWARAAAEREKERLFQEASQGHQQ